MVKKSTAKAKTASASAPAAVKSVVTTVKPTPASAESDQPRRLRLPVKHVPRRFKKRAKAAIKPAKLPNAFRLLVSSFKPMASNWKLFGGLILIYVLVSLVFVIDPSTFSNISSAKATFQQVAHGHLGSVFSGTATFAYVLGTAGSSTQPSAGVYELLFAIVISLAVIWALRQVYAKHRVRVRDAFYRGMYPLIPFLLVLAIIALKLVPMVIVITVYGDVASGGIASTSFEQGAWAVTTFLVVVYSLYWVCPSILALYAVSLPDIEPLAALRATRSIVRYRRWSVLRKMLFLPLAMVLIAAIITVPFIIFLTPVAPWVFLVLSAIALPFIHGYLYALYRALL